MYTYRLHDTGRFSTVRRLTYFCEITDVHSHGADGDVRLLRVWLHVVRTVTVSLLGLRSYDWDAGVPVFSGNTGSLLIAHSSRGIAASQGIPVVIFVFPCSRVQYWTLPEPAVVCA